MYYAIAEAHGSVGSVISRDNCRLWYSESKGTTAASNEATEFDDRDEAEAKAIELGDWWAVVEMGD